MMDEKDLDLLDDRPQPPALLESLEVVLDEPKLPTQPDLEKVREADMQDLNQRFKIMHLSWSRVDSISQVLDMMKESRALLKERRDILGLEYGATQSKGSAVNTYTALP